MSYSFSKTAAERESVAAQVAEAMDTVIANQPVHEAEKEILNNSVQALLGKLDAAEGKDFHAAVNGSISTYDGVVQSIAMNISVAVVARESQQTG